MHKVLSPRAHGVLDYAVVVAFLMAPSIFAFSGTPAVVCYVLAAAHLAMTLITAFPLGFLRYIPFPAHGQLELIVGCALVAMPWFAGFGADDKARWFFVFAGLVLLGVRAVTDYRAAIGHDADRPATPG